MNQNTPRRYVIHFIDITMLTAWNINKPINFSGENKADPLSVFSACELIAQVGQHDQEFPTLH